jgi:predicted enzyme related to lactoylglutathione lyase
MSPAIDIPQGRLAVIADPQGATFAVIQNAR